MEGLLCDAPQMSEYLLTLDQKTYSLASDLRIVPGQTIVQRGRMFGSD